MKLSEKHDEIADFFYEYIHFVCSINRQTKFTCSCVSQLIIISSLCIFEYESQECDLLGSIAFFCCSLRHIYIAVKSFQCMRLFMLDLEKNLCQQFR